jgi:hypothetical protein
LLLILWILATLPAMIFDTTFREPLLLAAAVWALSISLAWWHFGRGALTLGDLAYAPIYAARKVPMYVRYVIARETRWIRTKRDS